MKVFCNGQEQELTPGARVTDCLNTLGLDPLSVVVECDGKILTREEYASHELQDGSVLELIRFVGGG
ncbi:MAG: sulfur carrier protein ThiS [Desulfurivibrionaceae bacterium]|jgi:sulfur carrier protein|nr:sulfur carrier protein ThiS [Pseudomonadota bacterium]MCG2824325.1 sulfur carrier protein ThiS [Desulfobulbaceae bacterium]MDP2002221.1 sulfur carrier protein ThiS [Desulfurivibrionaceae bacterium]MBU4407472.1 sulfur carrier protein ThiS [Pseudomonadota bacterium]MBU4412412.1 sulfur carrier protein ThiS [Pseudomonadota bacterium]